MDLCEEFFVTVCWINESASNVNNFCSCELQLHLKISSCLWPSLIAWSAAPRPLLVVFHHLLHLLGHVLLEGFRKLLRLGHMFFELWLCCFHSCGWLARMTHSYGASPSTESDTRARMQPLSIQGALSIAGDGSRYARVRLHMPKARQVRTFFVELVCVQGKPLESRTAHAESADLSNSAVDRQ